MLLKIEGSPFFAVWALRIFNSAPRGREFFAKADGESDQNCGFFRFQTPSGLRHARTGGLVLNSAPAGFAAQRCAFL